MGVASDAYFAAVVQLNAEEKQGAQNSWQTSPDLRQVSKVNRMNSSHFAIPVIVLVI